MKNFSLIKKILLGLLLVIVVTGVFIGIKKLSNTSTSSGINKSETNQEISKDDNDANTDNNEKDTTIIS